MADSGFPTCEDIGAALALLGAHPSDVESVVARCREVVEEEAGWEVFGDEDLLIAVAMLSRDHASRVCTVFQISESDMALRMGDLQRRRNSLEE